MIAERASKGEPPNGRPLSDVPIPAANVVLSANTEIRYSDAQTLLVPIIVVDPNPDPFPDLGLTTQPGRPHLELPGGGKYGASNI